MEYVYPGCGFEKIIDQFVIGDKLLVAPILKKGTMERDVILPEGSWKNEITGEIVEGGCTVSVSAELNQVPVFVKC